LISGTIRFRLACWYALALLLVLGIGGMVCYRQIPRILQNHVDQGLRAMEAGIGELSGRVGAGASADCSALAEFSGRTPPGGYLRLVDAGGNILCLVGNGAGRVPPVAGRSLAAAQRGGSVLETVPVAEGKSVRQLTLTLQPGRDNGLFLQVGSGMCQLQQALHDLRSLLISVFLGTLLVLALAGWFLAGRALAPVRCVTRAMARIDGDNLSQRLPAGAGRDEVARMVDGFNAMLTRLEEAFRRVKQFSGDASHELRTPLTILKGETEVGLRWAKQPDEFRKILESSMEEIDRMSRIIDDLLLLAKSESGQKPLAIKELSLSDLLQELYLQGRTLAEAKGIEVLLHPNVTEEIRIRGDELRLRQVFLNLITNAIKYTPDHGRVEISLDVAGDEVVVTVSDTGVGIAPEHLPHIFERFYRIDSARNRQDGGTGLGLAIVQSFVKAHQGRIEVNSLPGQGSSFAIFLPVAGPQTPPAEDFPSR